MLMGTRRKSIRAGVGMGSPVGAWRERRLVRSPDRPKRALAATLSCVGSTSVGSSQGVTWGEWPDESGCLGGFWVMGWRTGWGARGLEEGDQLGSHHLAQDLRVVRVCKGQGGR